MEALEVDFDSTAAITLINEEAFAHSLHVILIQECKALMATTGCSLKHIFCEGNQVSCRQARHPRCRSGTQMDFSYLTTWGYHSPFRSKHEGCGFREDVINLFVILFPLYQKIYAYRSCSDWMCKAHLILRRKIGETIYWTSWIEVFFCKEGWIEIFFFFSANQMYPIMCPCNFCKHLVSFV